MSAIQRRGVLLDGIGAELVRASTGGARKTLSKWLADLSAAINLGDVASTFTSGDATPSVLNNSKFITAGSTAITNFDDGVEGQTITIYRGDSDIAIVDNATIDPIIAGNVTLSAARPSATFRLASGVWKQVEEAGAVSTAMASVVQASTLAAGRDALGVEIGADVLAYSADVSYKSATETISGAKTFTGVGGSSPRAFGENASFRVLNAAATKDFSFGIKDSDSSLYIGGGYGAGQGLVPAIAVKDTSGIVAIGGTDGPGGLLSVFSSDAYGQNDWTFWTRRTGSTGGGAESLWRNEHYGASPHPYLAFLSSRGSSSSPTAVQSGDLLGGIGGRLFDGTSNVYAEYRNGMTDDVVSLVFKANENSSGSAHGTRQERYTTANGATTPTLRETLSHSGELMLGTQTTGGGLFTVLYALNAIPGASAGLAAIEVADQLSGGPSVRFYNDTDTGFGRLATNAFSTFCGASEITRHTTTALLPGSNNAYTLGNSSFRWSEVFATNGTINTSDAREKTALEPLPTGVKRAIRKIMSGVGVYQWLASVAAKGEDKARLHVGVTAQSVRDAFIAEGEDPTRYALFCRDDIFVERVEDVTADELVTEMVEVDGRFVPGEVLRPITRQQRTMEPAGDRLGLRHDQLFYLALAVLFEG